MGSRGRGLSPLERGSLEGLDTERQLMRVVADRLSRRWYLGYDLTEPLPDHSSLSRIRERDGGEIFQHFFAHSVDLCQQAGLVWGTELIFDATQVRANADADSLVPRFYLRAKAHVAALFTPEITEVESATATDSPPRPAEAVESASAPDQSAPSPGPLPTGLPREEAEHWAEENRAIWKLLEQRRLDPEHPPSGPYQRLIDLRVSTTDPDAALMRLKLDAPQRWRHAAGLSGSLGSRWGQGADYCGRPGHPGWSPRPM